MANEPWTRGPHFQLHRPRLAVQLAVLDRRPRPPLQGQSGRPLTLLPLLETVAAVRPCPSPMLLCTRLLTEPHGVMTALLSVLGISLFASPSTTSSSPRSNLAAWSTNRRAGTPASNRWSSTCVDMPSISGSRRTAQSTHRTVHLAAGSAVYTFMLPCALSSM